MKKKWVIYINIFNDVDDKLTIYKWIADDLRGISAWIRK